MRKFGALLGLVLLLLVPDVACDPPVAVSAVLFGPGSAYATSQVLFRVTVSPPVEGEMYYVLDWGDGSVDTSPASYSGGPLDPDTAVMSRAWKWPGEFEVKAMAFADGEPSTASDWSDPHPIAISSNIRPATPVLADLPAGAPKGSLVRFSAMSWDPDGDSVSLMWDFDDWSGWVADSTWVPDSNRFMRRDTLDIWCVAKDTRGSVSDTAWVRGFQVGEEGGVLDWWRHDEQGALPVMPAQFWWYGNEELLAVPGKGEVTILRVLGDRLVERDVERYQDESEPQAVVYSSTTGRLYIFTTRSIHAVHPEHGHIWTWPELPQKDWKWGAPAVNGTRIYAPDYADSLYYLVDAGSTATLMNTAYVPLAVGCVVDNYANVIVSSDEGLLYKFDSELSTQTWRMGRDESLSTPVLGDEGEIYIGCGQGGLHRYEPSGYRLWSVDLESPVKSAVVGEGAVYAVSAAGRAYAVARDDGRVLWTSTLGEFEIRSSPILTADEKLYVMDEGGVLHCLAQVGGRVLWSSDVRGQGPGGGQRPAWDRLALSGTAVVNGDLIIPDHTALFRIKGNHAGQLDNTPWPKWQCTQGNSGKLGGF